MSRRIRRCNEDDRTREMADTLHELACERTGAMPKHADHYSFDPAPRSGNAENFIGAAQVPMRLARPACIDGDGGLTAE
jgi:hydroxymethylglutaryl-CoA reductase